MNSREYWEQRAAAREDETYRKTAAYAKTVDRAYRSARLALEEKIAKWLLRFMKNNEIDRTTAMTMLTGDALQEWRWTLREYIERGHIPEKYARELENVSARVHITRYAAMLEELGAIAEETYGLEETGLAGHLRGVYEERYLRAGFDAQQMIGTGWNIAMPDRRKIDAAVRTPWADGKNFSDRIWRDKRKLTGLIQPLVNRMIFVGEAPDNAIRILSHELNVSRTNAARLIQTESAHIAAVADRDCYEELGLEKVQFLATLEKHTCSACGSLDGTIVDMKDYAPGVNIPPIHPRCRCTTVPYFEDAEGKRIARDASTGEQYDVPESMTFEEWLETQREQYGDEYVDIERKKAYSQYADKRQYERFRELLGDDAPATFEAFGELKHSGADEWNMMMLDYRRRSRLKQHPELRLPHAETATAEDRKFTGYLFNPENPDGWAKGIAIMQRLGYSGETFADLKMDILSRASHYPAKRGKTDAYGTRYSQQIVIYGSKKKPTNMLVAWCSREEKTWLTSAYITEVE